MNRPVIDEAPASHSQQAAPPPGRSLSLVSGGPLSRHRTVTLLAALVLALVAALVGPFGEVQRAHAEDGNPTFYLGQQGADYIAFINRIRAMMNDGASTSVPGAGTGSQVTHLNPNNPARFLQVDIHLRPGTYTHGNGFVRLQLDRTNLYVLGWWGNDNVYYYLGGPTRVPDYGERGRNETVDGKLKWRAPERWQRVGDENYSRLETTAGERRDRMQITTSRMNAAAMWLYGDNSNFNNQDRARGVLRMTQFISEATRFRPIRDEISLSLSPTSFGFVMSPELARQENNWDNLCQRFNWLLRQRAGFRDPNPLIGYRRDSFNHVAQIVLYTAAQYAQYILATSKGR